MEELNPYTLIETSEFLGLVSDTFGSVQRWDEIKWAEDWTLERDPKLGDYLPHYNLWVLMLNTSPMILVYYEIDEERRSVVPIDVVELEL